MYDLYVYGSGECDQLGIDFGENDDLETSTPKKLEIHNLEPNFKIYKTNRAEKRNKQIHNYSWGFEHPILCD